MPQNDPAEEYFRGLGVSTPKSRAENEKIIQESPRNIEAELMRRQGEEGVRNIPRAPRYVPRYRRRD